MSAPTIVRIFGYLFAAFCLGSLWLYFLTAHVPGLPSGTSYFITANLGFYSVGSLGL